MDSTQHGIVCAASAVAGAYVDSIGGIPFATSAVARFVGSAADIVVGAGIFLVAHHIKKDIVSDVGEAFGVGMILSSGLTLLGL
jgi:hypothetical protein